MTLTADYVTNQPLPFRRMRQMLEDQGGGIQEGVVGSRSSSTDFRVSQRAAGGAGMFVDVALGAAWVEIDTGTLNGMSHILSDALATIAVPAAHATLPRLDQVVLQYNDTAIPAGVGGDIPTLRLISGTATSGATIDNRTGAAALPNDCVRIADIIVAPAAASILNANIRDRRPWARGALMQKSLVTPGVISSTAAVPLTPDVSGRLELSGAPIKVTVRMLFNNSAAGSYGQLWPHAGINGGTVGNVGLLLDPSEGQHTQSQIPAAVVAQVVEGLFTYRSPPAGTYFWRLMAANGAGNITPGNASITVEEVLRPAGIVDNGTT